MPVVYDDYKLADCICEDCPTLPKPTFPKADGVFCAIGKTLTITERKGCLCKKCNVYSENGVCGAFFCIEGPAD